MSLIIDTRISATSLPNGENGKPAINRKERGLLSVFPEWNKNIFDVARVVDGIVIDLAKKHGLWNMAEPSDGESLSPSQLLPHILKVKGPNVFGVIGGMVQGDLEGREDLAILAGLLTRFVWDVPDAGDFVNIRMQADTKVLFSIPKSVFTGAKLAEQKLINTEYQPLVDFLYDLKVVTQQYVDKVFNRLTDRQSVDVAKGVIARMIGEYGESVGIMHIQDPNIRNYLKKLHLEKALRENRDVIPWLNTPDLWYLSQVNTLGILGIVNEVSTTPDLRVGEIEALENYYDQVSSFVLVVLDDINDVEEDEKYGDPNFFAELLAGQHIEQIRLMEQQYGEIPEFSGFDENHELATQYFFALLGRAYLEKEKGLINNLGKERSYKHQKMFRDMVKFYRLQLMMSGKTPDSSEIICMDTFSFEIGDIV